MDFSFGDTILATLVDTPQAKSGDGWKGRLVFDGRLPARIMRGNVVKLSNWNEYIGISYEYYSHLFTSQMYATLFNSRITMGKSETILTCTDTIVV